MEPRFTATPPHDILERVMFVKGEPVEKKLLKVMLWVYIALCVVIAGLNYGYAPRADAKTAQFLTWFWHFYENWVKTTFILAASFLTIRITSRSGRTALRKMNLIGFIAAALVVHVAAAACQRKLRMVLFHHAAALDDHAAAAIGRRVRFPPEPLPGMGRGGRDGRVGILRSRDGSGISGDGALRAQAAMFRCFACSTALPPRCSTRRSL